MKHEADTDKHISLPAKAVEKHVHTHSRTLAEPPAAEDSQLWPCVNKTAGPNVATRALTLSWTVKTDVLAPSPLTPQSMGTPAPFVRSHNMNRPSVLISVVLRPR